ncbi:MAG TPA: hypothetical protein PLD10_23700, partial [Rhodopila sp.]|nr:hypothetical protein [Rhodopila sp.]
LQADSNVASFTVADTAANIAANFDALNADTKVTAIASSTGPVVITDAQYHTDTAAIAMLAQTVEVVVVPNAPVADAAALQADQNVASFTIADTASAVAAQATALNADTALTAIAITDTAANIATALDTLNTLAPAFTITSTNGPVTITETQYQGDLTAIAALEQTGGMLAVTGATAADAAALQADSNVASFTVADTAANVVAALDGLQADSHLSSVSLTDSGTPTLTISATQFANDTAALDKLTGNYNLVVTGVSAAAVTSVEADSHVTSFSVSDTASNLVQNIASLSNASSVTLTGSNSVQLSQSEQLATLPGFTIASGASLTTAGLGVTDTTTGQALSALPQAYSGPVSVLTDQLIAVNSDNLNIAVTTDNWFLHSGSGEDALAVHGGTNVLDGGTGSNFLVGGTGSDTFFVDDRGASADIWSTVVNFHAGDSATVWGVTPQDFSINWVDGQGAAGYTGLTLHATATGQPTASITLAGLTSADLTNGTLSVQYGTVGGSNYMYIHHN